MIVKCVKVGFLKCNCYVVINDMECLVIDPGDEFDKIVNLIGNNKLLGILVTHSHFDHIGCVDDLVNKYNVSVYNYNNLKEGNNKIGCFSFEVIYTGGHAKDSVTYYFRKDKIMFTGDFLFKNTIGRCDLEDSNFKEMVNSIRKIKKYDDDIVIYPGHGDNTNLGNEKKNNSYFKEIM